MKEETGEKPRAGSNSASRRKKKEEAEKIEQERLGRCS
jgi:hypothetical protein